MHNNEIALVAAALGVSAAEVFNTTKNVHEGTKAKLAEAQARPGSVVAFLKHQGVRNFVNIDQISRPAGSAKATIFATNEEAAERIIDASFDPMLALLLTFDDAVTVLKDEEQFLAETLAAYEAPPQFKAA